MTLTREKFRRRLAEAQRIGDFKEIKNLCRQYHSRFTHCNHCGTNRPMVDDACAMCLKPNRRPLAYKSLETPGEDTITTRHDPVDFMVVPTTQLRRVAIVTEANPVFEDEQYVTHYHLLEATEKERRDEVYGDDKTFATRVWTYAAKHDGKAHTSIRWYPSIDAIPERLQGYLSRCIVCTDYLRVHRDGVFRCAVCEAKQTSAKMPDPNEFGSYNEWIEATAKKGDPV